MATAYMFYTNESRWVMNYYAHALRESVFPYYRIYRQALLDIFADRFDDLKQAPEIRIGVSHLPRWLGARSAITAGLIAYNIEKYVPQDAASDARVGAWFSSRSS